jgi:hypothetical protein
MRCQRGQQVLEIVVTLPLAFNFGVMRQYFAAITHAAVAHPLAKRPKAIEQLAFAGTITPPRQTFASWMKGWRP